MTCVYRTIRAVSFFATMSIAVLVSHAPSQAAQPGRLSGGDIRELVTGTTIHMHTPVGTVIPVIYAEDGTVSGRTSGFVAYYLGASRDRGKWWIRDRKLCQQWKVWFDGQAKCIVIRRKGSKFHWRDGQGKTGVATIARRGTAATAPKNFKALKKPYALGASIAPALPGVMRPGAAPRKRVAATSRPARVTNSPPNEAIAPAMPRDARMPLPVRPTFQSVSRSTVAKTSSWTMRTY